MVSLKQFMHLLRIPQWSKAAFVLLGVIYSGASAVEFWPRALLAALSFCCVASAVYIYNDLRDREQDSLHPHKSRRPLAQGEVSLLFALITALTLLLGGFIIAFFISKWLSLFLAIYLIINFLYNHGLKNIPVLDVLCITSGFMLRVLSGTVGIGIQISWWLISAATFLSLLIALGKRRLEQQLDFNMLTRAVLRKYSPQILDLAIATVAFISFITYLFYCIFERGESFYFMLTLPFAGLGLLRFAKLCMQSNQLDDPVAVFLKDKIALFAILCFLLLTLLAVVKHGWS